MIKLTPPMGWNSWNTFGENINEKMIFETADVMAESGLRDKGYEYLVIDDCWSLRERDENGRLVPDPEKFPHVKKEYGQAFIDWIVSRIAWPPSQAASTGFGLFSASRASAVSRTRSTVSPRRQLWWRNGQRRRKQGEHRRSR